MHTAKLPPYVALHDKVVLYDGVCRLCGAWAKFLIRFDHQHRFKLATVQSPEGQALLRYFNLPLTHYETMVLIEGTEIYTESTAFIRVMARLPWYLKSASIVWVIPKFMRDFLYRHIAKNRYQFFGKNDACLMPAPDHQRRFLDHTIDAIAKTAYQHQMLYVLLGETTYHQLPTMIQVFHQTPETTWQGTARVSGGNHILLKIIRIINALPPITQATPINVTVHYQGNEEMWVRQFGNSTFTSYLGCDLSRHLMYERIGPLKFYFKLRVAEDALFWDFQSLTLFNCPLPKFLAPAVKAKESISPDHTYQFYAYVRLPILGVLVDYEGTIQPSEPSDNVQPS